MKKTFTLEDLLNMDDVEEEILETNRWSYTVREVYQDEAGAYWELTRRRPATEYQEGSFDDEPIEAVQVHPVERQVTVRFWE